MSVNLAMGRGEERRSKPAVYLLLFVHVRERACVNTNSEYFLRECAFPRRLLLPYEEFINRANDHIVELLEKALFPFLNFSIFVKNP
jgi:hypothetical protein